MILVKKVQNVLLQTYDHNIQLLPLCRDNMKNCSLEAGNVSWGQHCEANIARKPDRILSCTWNMLTKVMSEGNITCKGNITGQHDRILPCSVHDMLSTNDIAYIAYEYLWGIIIGVELLSDHTNVCVIMISCHCGQILKFSVKQLPWNINSKIVFALHCFLLSQSMAATLVFFNP